MEITNTMDSKVKPPVHMVVYGEGGVGKTTFAAKAPNAIIADCEGGTKYLGSRGLDVDVVQINEFNQFSEFVREVKNSDYETIVIDPIGELMEKLQRHMRERGKSKHVQKDGSPTMAGWGWLKKQLRNALKSLRDSGKNVVIVAHVEEKGDGERFVKRPMLQTKMSEEMVNMVDIVAYMTVVDNPHIDEPAGEESSTMRVLICDPESDKYIAKDRTGQLGHYNLPEWHGEDREGNPAGILDLVYQGDWDDKDTNNEENTQDTGDDTGTDDRDDGGDDPADEAGEDNSDGEPETEESEEVQGDEAESDAEDSEPQDGGEGDQEEDIKDDAIYLEDLGFDTRVIKILNDADIETADDLEYMGNPRDINGVGEKTAEQIDEVRKKIMLDDSDPEDKKANIASKLDAHNE